MEYKASLPGKNDNVSHDRPAREFVLLLSGITAALLAAFWILGFFVDVAVDHISPEMEAVIFGSRAVPLSAKPTDTDPRQAELQRLTDQLRTCIDIAYPLKVILIDSDKANAMAFPGGRILVLKGLLDTVSSENGLSFVLAHELAHFKHRDHLKGMGRGIVLTALSAVLTGAGSDVTRVLAPSINFGMAQYSQDRETRADQEALSVLNCFYGHTGGASEFFKAVKPDPKGVMRLGGHYFDSHPEAMERIETLDQMAKERHFSQKKVLPLPDVFKE